VCLPSLGFRVRVVQAPRHASVGAKQDKALVWIPRCADPFLCLALSASVNMLSDMFWSWQTALGIRTVALSFLSAGRVQSAVLWHTNRGRWITIIHRWRSPLAFNLLCFVRSYCCFCPQGVRIWSKCSIKLFATPSFWPQVLDGPPEICGVKIYVLAWSMCVDLDRVQNVMQSLPRHMFTLIFKFGPEPDTCKNLTLNPSEKNLKPLGSPRKQTMEHICNFTSSSPAAWWQVRHPRVFWLGLARAWPCKTWQACCRLSPLWPQLLQPWYSSVHRLPPPPCWLHQHPDIPHAQPEWGLSLQHHVQQWATRARYKCKHNWQWEW